MWKLVCESYADGGQIMFQGEVLILVCVEVSMWASITITDEYDLIMS